MKIDFERFAAIAKSVGAYFMVDMAHYAGLIAAGVYPNPVPHADVVTSTTHKSLRGPRGGIILMKAEHEKAINSAIFPGLQGGPLMHVIAAKAVAFKEALAAEFKDYQRQVLVNADAMARTLASRGLRIVSGRTESHVMLVDLRPKGITGKEAEAVLGQAHITVNKNAIPERPREAFRHQRRAPRFAGDDHARFPPGRGRADRTPDRRRARPAEGPGEHRGGAWQGRRADEALPGVRRLMGAGRAAMTQGGR